LEKEKKGRKRRLEKQKEGMKRLNKQKEGRAGSR
jgi:hypothetical protein